MATVEAELLAAIGAAPDDDAPRLVFADWLSERGDPRGEQIAVEIALARAAPDAAERSELAARAVALRASIADPVVEGVPVRFRRARGMIEHAELPLPALLARDHDLFAVAPLLRSVEVTGVDEVGIAALLARPWFPRLRSLELSWHVPDEAIVAVARSPAVRGLERVSIHHAGLRVPSFVALGASEHLAALRVLDLSLSGATDEAVAAMLGDGALPSLASLGLSNNTLGTAGCTAIAGHAAPLRELHVGSNRLGHRGVSAIASSPHRRDLAVLALDHVQTGEKGCAALAEAGLRLEVLWLRQSKVDDAGARHLLRSASLMTTLRDLDLRDNNLSADVAAELRERLGTRVRV